MLVFSVLLLATSVLAAAGVPLVDPQQNQSDYSQTGHYVGAVGLASEQVVPVSTPVPNYYPYVNTAFHQPTYAHQGPFVKYAANGLPVHYQAHQRVVNGKVVNYAPNGVVNPYPVQGVFGRSQYHHLNGVLPQNHAYYQGFPHYYQHPQVAKAYVSNNPVGNARIVQQDMAVNPDGSFHNVWSSDNGISVQEHGSLRRVGDVDVAVQQGAISYIDNEGNQFDLKYVADENGFHPEGAHLPTPPPIPEAIARSLQYNAEHPYVETTTVQNQYYQPGQQHVDN